ncbi:unnamed protein product [Pylaiella littoralis]
MASSYGSLGGEHFGDDSRALGSSSSSSSGGPHFLGGRKQEWPWLRIGIASIAVVATLGLLSASRLASYTSDATRTASTYTLVDSSAGTTGTPNLATVGGDAPGVSGTRTKKEGSEGGGAAGAAQGGDAGGPLFVAENEYTRRGDVVGLGYPWLQDRILVEPFRKTTLSVVSPREGMSYTWRVTPVEEVDVQSDMQVDYSGGLVEVTFERAPKYQVVLEERDAPVSTAGVGGGGGVAGEGDGTVVVRSSTTEIFCKYVRREIRSLFEEERNMMFDAMKVLWDVKVEEGRDLYGPDYLDVWSIDMFHQVGASDIECDHLHDGIGFGITHSMVTMIFENSMQLVNPMVSLPYWDFTIEGAIIDEEFDGDYTKLAKASPLWTPDWFGGVDKSDYQVKDGRWGSLTVPILPEEQRNMVGADVYGRMRSPWNVNSRPFLTRGLGEMCGLDSTEFYTWPGCASHYDLQDRFTSYYGYTWWSQYGPHGPMHVWVGGNVDCKKDMDVVMGIVGEDYRLSMTGYLFVMRKDMFRDTTFKCVGQADPDTSEEEVMTKGMCGCLEFDLTQGDDYLKVFENFSSYYTFDKEFTEDEKRILAAQWCNGQVGIGESSESSSPLDPTFWSMHPTMERLLVFKLLAGTFTDWSWPDEVGTWTGMGGVEYDVTISTRSDTCYGHRGSDVFPYDILSDLITPQFTFYGKKAPNTMQNRQLIKIFDPSENALPFIYDNFEWSHCAEMGYDFSDFFNPSTMKSGPKGSAASREEKEKPGRVHGFSLFESGRSHRNPGFDPPVAVQNILEERAERQQQGKQKQKKTHA